MCLSVRVGFHAETWAPLETLILAHAVSKYGENNWNAVAKTFKLFSTMDMFAGPHPDLPEDLKKYVGTYGSGRQSSDLNRSY